jgi:hypothetical protein
MAQLLRIDNRPDRLHDALRGVQHKTLTTRPAGSSVRAPGCPFISTNSSVSPVRRPWPLHAVSTRPIRSRPKTGRARAGATVAVEDGICGQHVDKRGGIALFYC